MTIAVHHTQIPADMVEAVMRLNMAYRMVVVPIEDLKALEEAKARYERFYLDHEKLHSTLSASAQRSSEAVAHENTKQSPCLRPGDLNTTTAPPCTLHAENAFLLEEFKSISSAYARLIAFLQTNSET